MTVTIRHVAKRLRLSITTVSRALDGYDDVAESTRKRVRRVAAEMGYAPSHTARQMRRRRADAIGYVISLPPTAKADADSRLFADPFASEFIAGLGDEATRHNLDLVVSTATPDAEERAVFERWARGRRVDGVVLNRLRLDDWRVTYLKQIGLPFVASGRIANADFPYIEVDGRSGFKQLVSHLAERGHTRIAYIGGPSGLRLQADRLAGFRAGLRESKLSCDSALIVQGDLTRNGGYRAAQKLLSAAHPPTAIVGVNDMTALGAMRAAREHGCVVGRDIAIAGFDGTSDGEHADPPLTTLTQPVYAIARGLVDMLIALINGEHPRNGAMWQVVLQPELIVRASTRKEP